MVSKVDDVRYILHCTIGNHIAQVIFRRMSQVGHGRHNEVDRGKVESRKRES
jgi:hypothetical protein